MMLACRAAQPQSAATHMHMHTPQLHVQCAQHGQMRAAAAGSRLTSPQHAPVHPSDFACTIKQHPVHACPSCSLPLSSRATHRATHSSWFDKLARQTFDEVDVDNDGNLDHKELYIALLKL